MIALFHLAWVEASRSSCVGCPGSFAVGLWPLWAPFLLLQGEVSAASSEVFPNRWVSAFLLFQARTNLLRRRGTRARKQAYFLLFQSGDRHGRLRGDQLLPLQAPPTPRHGKTVVWGVWNRFLLFRSFGPP